MYIYLYVYIINIYIYTHIIIVIFIRRPQLAAGERVREDMTSNKGRRYGRKKASGKSKNREVRKQEEKIKSKRKKQTQEESDLQEQAARGSKTWKKKTSCKSKKLASKQKKLEARERSKRKRKEATRASKKQTRKESKLQEHAFGANYLKLQKATLSTNSGRSKAAAKEKVSKQEDKEEARGKRKK